jgi:hypothetical protein
MTQLFKGVALFAVVTCVVWVSVLWRWESTSRNMTVFDIVMYLGFLPLAVFGVLAGLQWAWRGAPPRREATVAAAAARSAAETAAAALPITGEDERHAVCLLLAAHLTSAAGGSPGELLASVAENEPRPSLDDELRDADGIKVMSARVPDLQTAALTDLLEPLLSELRQAQVEWADLDISVHATRALAALSEPLARTLQALRPWAVRLGAPDREAAHGGLHHLPARPGEAAPMIRVLLGWPAGWSEFERELATRWVHGRLTEDTAIPADRFAVTAHADNGEDLWLRADQLLRTLARERRHDLLLVAACHSDLSDSAIGMLADSQRLFSARQRPKGLMPGEAAAAMLLAPDDWPADPDSDRPPARLQRPAVLRRDKSIEVAGRVGSQCLQDAIANALDAAHLAPQAIPALVCDADQHTSRGAELFGAVLAALPALEPNEDTHLIGTLTGHVGAVSTLLVVSAAAEVASASNMPCLALCLGDPFMRMALIARPGTAAVPPP